MQAADCLACCGTRIFLADEAASSSADRCHSLTSLHPPQAALGSLPMVGMTVDLAVAAPESLK